MFPFVVCLVIVVADQLTKFWVRSSFYLHESYPVIPGFFDLTYIKNTGAAWGMFRGQNTALILLSIVMLLVLIIFRRSFLSDIKVHRWALGLMLGGIIGNLIDRVFFQFVTDFLDFYIKSHHWPAFNIADAAICSGVFLYIVSSFWLETHPLNENRMREMANGEGGLQPHSSSVGRTESE